MNAPPFDPLYRPPTTINDSADTAAVTANNVNSTANDTVTPVISPYNTQPPTPRPSVSQPVAPATTNAASTSYAPASAAPVQYPIVGLNIDLRVNSSGCGSDREWLDLKTARSHADINPAPIVAALYGADHLHQPFINSLPANTPRTLTLLSYKQSYQFLKAKPKRSSYDNYEPVGILKSHWMIKYRYLVPATIIYIYEWEEGKSYDTHDMAIQVRLSKLKQDLNNRDTRIILLIVRARGFTSEEERELNDKLLRLLRKISIDVIANKSLLLMGINELRTSIKRLESYIIDLSIDYYKDKIKKLKQLKHKINKNTQHILYVRHHFKIAYFSEVIGDIDAAIKYYHSSYDYLIASITNASIALYESAVATEVKAVSMVIYIRHVRLLLNSNQYDQAVSRLSAHIHAMKRCVGLSNMLFAHWQWFAQQYRLFADLLDANNIIKKNSGCNAGIYYQVAASYAVKRKLAATPALQKTRSDEIAAGPNSTPFLLPVNSLAPPAYLGHARLPHPIDSRDDGRGTTTVYTFVVTTSPHDLFRSVLSQEAVVDHSSQIVQLLNKSYEAFKKVLNERSVLYVAYDLAMEYHSVGNYTMSIKFLERIAPRYRDEQWNILLTNTILLGFECAIKLNRLHSIIDFGIELMGKNCMLSLEQREILHHRFIAAIKANENLITNNNNNNNNNNIFDIPSEWKSLECNTYFLIPQPILSVKNQVDIMISFKSNLIYPIYISSLTLIFNNNDYNNNNGRIIIYGSDLATSFTNNVTDDNAIIVESCNRDYPSKSTTFHHRFEPNITYYIRLRFTVRIPTTAPLMVTHLLMPVEFAGADPSLPNSVPVQLRCAATNIAADDVLKSIFPSPVYFDTPVHPKKKKHKDEEIRQKIAADEEERIAFASKRKPTPTVIVTPQAAQATVTVDHPHPPLIDEYYPLSVTIQTHNDEVRRPTLSMSVKQETPQVEFKPVDPFADPTLAPTPISLPSVSPEPHNTNCSFYTRKDSGSKQLDTTSGDDLLEQTGPFALPLSSSVISTNTQYTTIVYVKLTTTNVTPIRLDLSYENQENLTLHAVTEVTVTARMPLTIKYKIFSDGITGTAPRPLSTDTPVKLSVNKLCILQAELDNISGHNIALCYIAMDLNRTAFKQLNNHNNSYYNYNNISNNNNNTHDNHINGDNHNNNNMFSGAKAALLSTAMFADRHSTNDIVSSINPNTSSQPSSQAPVLLSPGERYIHLFYFTPTRVGRSVAASLTVHWTRVHVEKKEMIKPPPPLDRTQAEKQRDEILKKLIAEQRQRAVNKDMTIITSHQHHHSHNTSNHHVLSSNVSTTSTTKHGPNGSVTSATMSYSVSNSNLHVEAAENIDASTERKDIESSQTHQQETSVSDRSNAIDNDNITDPDSVNTSTTAAGTTAASLADTSDKVHDVLQRELKTAEAEHAEERNKTLRSSLISSDNIMGMDTGVGDADKDPTAENTDINDGMNVDNASGAADNDGNEWRPVELKRPLPAFTITAPTLTLTSSYPPTVTFGSSFDLITTVRNGTDRIEECEVHIAEDVTTPANSTMGGANVVRLVFSGLRNGKVRLMPREQRELRYTCLPLECGVVNLPRLTIRSVTTQTNINDPNECGTIFVRPRSKGLNNSTTTDDITHQNEMNNATNHVDHTATSTAGAAAAAISHVSSTTSVS